MGESRHRDTLKRFRWTYSTALGLLALLLLGLVLLSQERLRAQEEDAYIINLAGRQRMLSQRLVKELLLLESDRDVQSGVVSSLLTDWNKAHESLKQRSNTPATQLLTKQLDPAITSLTRSAENFLASRDSSALALVIQREKEFLGLMEVLVGTYELEARGRVRNEIFQQWMLLGVLILVLLAEVWFVFRPLAKTLESNFSELDQAHQSTERALEESRRATELKGQFLANMSHEIRTPMNGIIGMSELILAGDLQEHTREHAEIVRSSAESLLLVLNDVLDVSKIQAGEFKLQSLPFDLSTEVEDVAYLQAAAALKKNVEILVDISPEVPTHVKGDPNRLRQILLNLMSNAVKFTDEGHIFVRVQNKDGSILFEVIDTGPGIPKDKFDSLFRSFEQLDGSNTRKHQGTGLGLSIAASLVKLMGGEIGVHSELGVGSTFWFKLNLPAQKMVVSPQGEELKDKRFLIVDDVAVNRRLLSEWISDWGGTSEEAQDGEDALAKLESQNFDFILLDFHMPSLDGIQTAKRIHRSKARLVALPSIAEDNLNRFEQAGFHGLLRKPLKRRLLNYLLISLLDEQNRFVTADTIVRNTKSTPKPASGSNILIVDDSEVNRKVTSRFLKFFGIESAQAENGVVALEKLEEGAYDLILMDCQMPEMDGYEATRQIRSKGISIPIVALTASVLPENKQKCLEAGMDDYLTKPLSKDRLEDVLGKYLRVQSPALRDKP